MTYRHILAAISLDEQGADVLRRARAMAQQDAAKLSVLHVVEYIPLETGEALMAAPADLSQQLVEQAREQLTSLCAQQDVPESSVHIGNGAVSREVSRCVEELGADLIVVGHQPRRGFLASLFNHTEQDVVQRAPCDVLVVALP